MGVCRIPRRLALTVRFHGDGDGGSFSQPLAGHVVLPNCEPIRICMQRRLLCSSLCTARVCMNLLQRAQMEVVNVSAFSCTGFLPCNEEAGTGGPFSVVPVSKLREQVSRSL